jgi:hypothetical protein
MIERVLSHLHRQLVSGQAARKPAGIFLDEHQDQLRLVKLGSTFSPDHYHGLLSAQGVDDPTVRRRLTHAGLDFLHDRLGIAEVRLPIRWNQAVARDGRLNMRFYEPCLDRLIEQRANVCLNVGPIKVARWPEDHLPDWIPAIRRAMPPAGSVVGPGSELARHAFDHLDRLLSYLTARYSAHELACITVVQPENEPLSHFGGNRYFLSAEYMQRAADLIWSHLPGKPILINSLGMASPKDFLRGVSGLDAILGAVAEMQRRPGAAAARFVLGFDYYHFIPGAPWLPGLGVLDQLTLTNMRVDCLAAATRDRAGEQRPDVEVTEAQMEPWGNELPGASLEHFQFVLRRCLDIVKPTTPSTIRLWGVERLAMTMLAGAGSAEHYALCEAIGAINALTPAHPAREAA